MHTVTSRWEPFVRSGFNPVTRVDVRFPGEGTVFSDLPVESGTITLERGDNNRAHGTIVVPAPELFPSLNEGSPIGPYGAEIVVHTGVAYAPLQLELVPMGVFPIESVKGTERGGLISTIQFYDRSKRIAGTHFVAPQDFGGWLIQDAIEEVLTYAAPFYPGTGVEWSVVFDAELDNFALPGGAILDGDRWAFAMKLAKSLGAELYFDRDGNVQVAPVPGITPSTLVSEAVWRVDVGANGILIDADRSISRENIWNGVVVRGSATEGGSQPFYLATDDDPNSRTYWEGPFGKHALPIDRSELTTVDQCEIAARAELKNLTGQQANITFDAIGNPALDPGDILLTTYRSGQQQLFMLDGYTYDFRTAAMSGSTRSVHYVEDASES